MTVMNLASLAMDHFLITALNVNNLYFFIIKVVHKNAHSKPFSRMSFVLIVIKVA
jgi:hypothetical protein